MILVTGVVNIMKSENPFKNDMTSRKEIHGNKTVYYISPQYGSGTLTSYTVFNGAEVTYIDIEIHKAYNKYIDMTSRKGFIEINHCLFGRFECEFADHTFTYMGDNELAVYSCEKHVLSSNFTFRPYKGITVLIDVEKMDKTIKTIFKESKIDLYKLVNYLNSADKCFIIKSEAKIEHVFSELYTVELELQMDYLKIKVLELLLFLINIDIYEIVKRKKYYEKALITKVKSAKESLEKRKEKHVTIEQLSKEYNINMTTLKECFKDIYGMPIYTYIKQFRMHKAAELLRETNYKVSDIAGMVGYSNPSKFSEAFYQVIGIKPIMYRKSK